MNLNVCKLCNEDKVLKKSHVIPRSVFRNALKGQPYGKMLDRAKGIVVNTQDQWAAHMLCGECEQILSARYEKYSLEALRGNSKSTKLQSKNEYIQIVGVDQKRIINFVISILWRAIESDHEKFRYLKALGINNLITAHFKECVYKNSLPKQQNFTVRISKLITTIPEFKNMDLSFITTLSFNVIDGDFIEILFVMEGYCFEIFLHTKPNLRKIGLGILNKNKRILKMPYIEAFSIPELRQSLQEMINASS